MTSQELTQRILIRLKKYSILILLAGLIAGGALAFYASQKPVTYTSRATIFPLTSSGESSSASSAISALLGGNAENSKSFSEEASINIIELAQSRTTSEEVAAIRDTARGNKTIAELLVLDRKAHKGFFEPEINMPTDETQLITWAGAVLKSGLTASINKNGSFVLSYTGRDPDLVRTISYGFIDKISKFYIDLKREKAKNDFEFASSKVDSLRRVMRGKDAQLIGIDKRTMFTNTNKLEYRVPTENLIAEKQMIRQQYATAVANQQNAAYKLQKATPLIKVLDKPEPPYEVQHKSAFLYAMVGLMLGIFLTAGLLIAGILLRYLKEETSKVIFGTSKTTSTTVTPL